MILRQEADYGLKFSETGAIGAIDGAEALHARPEEILRIK